MKKLIFNYQPGQKVKLLDRYTLLAAGYPDNNDAQDFLNLLAGKEVVVDQAFTGEGIYTCTDEPDVAIHQVFIEKLIPQDEMTQVAIAKVIGISRNTVKGIIDRTIERMTTMIKDSGNEDDFKAAL